MTFVPSARGAKAKLTPDDVAIGRAYGITHTAVRAIRDGRRWGQLP